MYKCKYFKIHELVPPHIYEGKGEEAWNLLDEKILRFADYLRSNFGSITVNNYFWGGNRKWSGLRTPDSPYYSKTSQHSIGKALDMIFKNHNAKDIRSWLKFNSTIWSSESGINSITCEENVNWLHVDVRNNKLGYNSFKPG